jgi:carboxylesterase
MISADCGKMLADRIQQVEVDYHFFPEATHVITVGKDRNVFEETVLAFLNRLNWNEG